MIIQMCKLLHISERDGHAGYWVRREPSSIIFRRLA
jgi:hypothetical protein